MFLMASNPVQKILATLIVLVGICYFLAIIYAQIFIHGSGDFSTHAILQGAHYTYLYVLRDALGAIFNITPLHALAIILYTSVAVNVGAVFYLFLKHTNAPLIAALATAVMFLFVPVFNLVDRDIYLGQLSPNIWHNSTFLIAATPNLLLFIYGLSAMQRAVSARSVIILTLLAALSIGAKPTLFVVLVPAVIFYTLLFKRSLITRVALLWGLPVLIFLIYYGLILPKDVEAITAPGLVWAMHSSNILYSVLTSAVFFLGLAWVYKTHVVMSPEFLISVLAVGIGIIQFYLLAEPGHRQQDGNFSWGMHQAMSILLFSSLAFLLRQPWDRKMKLALLVSVPHLVSGLYYTAYILKTGGYWI